MEINYQNFLEDYKNNKITVLVDKTKAGRFIISQLANKRFKPAHYFWTWVAFLLIFILPIVLLFEFWFYSIVSLVAGIWIYGAAKTSASQFVLENMLEDEKFFEFVMENNGAIIHINK